MLNKAEIEQSYRRNFRQLFAIAAKIVGESEARDVVHDVFIKVYDLQTLPNNIDAYLAVAVRNRALTVVRQMSTFELIENALPLPDEDNQVQYPSSDELREMVNSELTPKVKAAVNRVFYEGESYKQAAEALNVSVATIHKHIVTALRKLRTLAKQQPE